LSSNLIYLECWISFCWFRLLRKPLFFYFFNRSEWCSWTWQSGLTRMCYAVSISWSWNWRTIHHSCSLSLNRIWSTCVSSEANDLLSDDERGMSPARGWFFCVFLKDGFLPIMFFHMRIYWI
jgi:hypothetical protein